MTKTELLELLKREDEWTLLELLDINSEELIDAFLDKVDEHLDRVYRHYDN